MKHTRICIITFPITPAGLIPLSNLVDIFTSISIKIFVISSEIFKNSYNNDKGINIFVVKHILAQNQYKRILNYISTQINITKIVYKYRMSFDTCVFFLGGESLIIPLLLSKLLRKKVYFVYAGSTILTAKHRKDIFTYCIVFMSYITKLLSDRIIIYSDRLIKEWNLKKYIKKISIAHEHFINFKEFDIKKRYTERSLSIGYVGRLSEEKGILNFVHAINIILEKRTDITFYIIGDGQLRETIENIINIKGKNKYVNLLGWVPHNELSSYLNELKVIVLPSYTEGLPNILLEAMASGTPVIASNVGAISDIIVDKSTGYILADNSPSQIADKINFVIDDPNIENIIINAYTLVLKNFTYDVTTKKIRDIFVR